MANDGATFYFDTNIEQTVNRVITGLSSVASATAKIHGGAVRSPLEGLEPKVAREVDKAKKQIGRLNEAFRNGGIDEGTLTRRYQDVVSRLSSAIGKLGKKAGIDLDVVLDYNKGVVRQFADLIKREINAALKSVDLHPDLKGRLGTGRVEARQADVRQGFDGGANTKAADRNTEKAARKRQKNAEDSADASADGARADRDSAESAKKTAKARRREAAAAERNAEAAGRPSVQQVPRSVRQGATGALPPLSIIPPTPGRDRTNAANFQRLTNGTYDDLIAGVTRLSSRFVADTRGKTTRIYKVVTDGFEEVERGTTAFFTQMQLLRQRLARQAARLDAGPDVVPTTSRQARQNQRDLTPGGRYAEGVTPIGGPASRYVADTRDEQDRIFKRVKNGFAEIAKGSAEFEAQVRALRAQQERQSPARKGIIGSFKQGLFQGSFFGGDAKEQSFGQQLDSLARSAGTTAKYAALSQAIYGLQTAFFAAGREVLDFEDSVTEMNIALESINPDLEVNQSTISRLGDSAALAGANVGQAMDLAGAAVRAFGDETDGSQEAIDNLQVSFAATASKLATISKTDIKDAAGNLRAIGQAFDIPPESFDRVLDVIAGAKQLGGGEEKEIGQGLANVGVIFKEIGFSIEETGAIISKIQSETDQGGTLIASRLSRISSIIGGSAGKSAILQLNEALPDADKVDTTASVKDQVTQLSAVYKDLGNAQRQQLINSLGGTANARELIILLENANELIAGADRGFTGKGVEEYKLRLQDIAAVLKNIQGEIKGVIGQFANSGALDPFYALAKEALLPALTAVRSILETFNEISRPLRTIAFTVGEIYLAFKLIQALGGRGFGGVARSLESAVRPQAALARQQVEATRRAQAAAQAARRTEARNARQLNRLAGDQAAAGANQAPARRVPRVPNIQVARLNPFYLGPQASSTGGPLGRVGIRQPVKDVAASTREALRPAALRDAVTSGMKAALRAPESVRRASAAPFRQFGDLRAAGATRGQAIATVLPTLSRGAERGAGGLKSVGRMIGPEGLALAGVTAAIAVNSKTREILNLAKQTDQLSNSKDIGTGSATDLNEAAKNLRSSADTLKQASSGLLGWVTSKAMNLFAGTDISQNAQDDADRLAAVYEGAARRREVARQKAVDTGDLTSQIDLSSPDALATSLQALDNAGYTATERVDALSGKLDQMATSLKTGTVALTEAQRLQVGADVQTRAGQEIRDIQMIARDTGQREVISEGRRDWRTGRRAPGKSRVLYSTLNADAISEQSAVLAQDFIKGGGDVNKEKSFKGLVELYKQQYLKAGLKPKDADDAAVAAATQTRQSVNKIGSKAAVDNMVAYFKTLNENLDAYGAEAATNYATGKGSKGVGSAKGRKGGALVAAEAALNQLDKDLASVDLAIEVAKAKGTPEGDAQAKQLEQAKKQAIQERKQRAMDVASKRVAEARVDFDELQASKPPENTLANLKAIEAEIDKELAVPFLDESDKQRLRTEKAQNQIAQQQAALRDKLAQGRAAIDPRDEVGNANQDVTDAQTVLDDMDKRGVDKKSADYLEAQRKLTEAQQNAARVQAEKDIAKRNIDAIPSSNLDTANRALDDARTRLKTMLKDSIEYSNQLAEVNKLENDVALAKNNVASINRQLRIDMTDPVQVAREQVASAREALERAREQTKGKDVDPKVRAEVVGKARLDLRAVEANEEAAAFQQFLSNAQTADQLGRISHKQYLAMLRNRADQLTAELAGMKKTDPMYRQITDQRDQLLSAVKAGADELSGVFNIGDIKVPTPYEVRKAIKEKDFGTILGSNPANSTAGNVTTDNSTRNITLNGVPIEEVLTMIEGLFGTKVRSRAARKS